MSKNVHMWIDYMYWMESWVQTIIQHITMKDDAMPLQSASAILPWAS